MNGGIAYTDTLNIVPINYEVGIQHQSNPVTTDHTILGRNESQVANNASFAYINADWSILPNTMLSSSINYRYFDAIKQGGVSFKGKVDHWLFENTRLTFQYQRLVRAPSFFSLYADMPIHISNDFDVWLSGNIVPQQVTTNPALISWNHPAFRPTPYVAGLSIQQAYNYVNEAAKEQLPERLIDLDPRNRPLAGLLDFLLTEEFAPIGFINDFTPVNYLTNKEFNHSISGISSARLNRIEQVGVTISKKIKKLQLESNLYYVREHNPIQLTVTNPYLKLNDLGSYLGQAVQNRIQLSFEELLVSAGAYTQEDAELKAEEIGQVLNEVYTEQGDLLFAELNQRSHHGTIFLDQAVREDKTQLMMGYATLEKSIYWGFDVQGSFQLSDALTISSAHHWINTTTYTTNTIFNENPVTYYLNRPKYRNSTSIEFQPSKPWKAMVRYNYESSFEANLGVFIGTVPAKNLVDATFEYKMRNGIELTFQLSNLFNQGYQSYPFMPIIGRTLIGTITYHF